MKSKLFRLISLVMVMVMLINMLPMSVFAEQYRESQLEASIAAANVVTDAQITEEITSDRSEFSKVFRMDNGLHIAAVYSEAVHFLDDEKWEEIDNTLQMKLDGTITNKAGIWDVSFPQQIGPNKQVSVTKDGHTLSFALSGELRQQPGLEIMSEEAPALEATVPSEEETVLNAEEIVPEETQEAETSEDEAEAEETSAASASEAEAPATEATISEEATPEETTVPAETEPELTEPEETTAPEETEPEETLPQETEPETTAPEETTTPEETTLPEEEITEPTLDSAQLVVGETAAVTIDGISQTFAVQTAGTVRGQIQSIDLEEAKAAAEHPEFILEKNVSQLRYADVYTNTDIQYDLRGNMVKESIILESYSNTLRGYRYTLNVGDMVPTLNDDGSIHFYADDDLVMVMPAPYLVDSSDEYSYDVHVSLTGSNGTYTLIYLLPQSWLASQDRSWPVVLDPAVQPDMSVFNIKDQAIAENGTFAYNGYYLECGYGPNNGRERFYVKYTELPTLTSADVVVFAQMNLLKPEVSNNGDTVVEVHRVPNAWESETITWAGNTTNFDPMVEDYAIVNDPGWYSWEVTDIVRDWYASNVNNGMMFKAADESAGNSWKRFYSSDIGTEGYKPTLVIAFRNANGLEGYWDYTSSSAGRAGTGSVNSYSGNLVWTRSDLGFGGNRMPVSISHVYNTADADNNDFGMGNGWRTNFNQKVYKWEEDSNYYVWEDSDGTRHYFEKENSTTFKDEDGLELTLNLKGSSSNRTYEIVDKNGNTSYFDTKGRLIKQENNQATKSSINISYSTATADSLLIDTITDGAGRKYQFTYNTSGLLTRIGYLGSGTSEITHVAFTYDSSKRLTGITDKDAETCLYTYNDANMLLTAQDIDGYTLTYAYDTPALSYQTYRVKKITESDNGKTGGVMNIEYAHNQTTFTDHNGNKEILQFNDFGNVVAIQDGEGRAQYAKYQINDNGESGKANQLRLSSKLQYTVSNLLSDSSFEADGNLTGWVSDSASPVMSAVKSSTSAYLGSKSVKVDTDQNTGRVISNQTYTIEPGATYTFSAYIKVTAGRARLGIRVDDTYAYSPVLSENTWTRAEASYTNNSTSSKTVTLVLQGGKSGADTAQFFADCVQFEKAVTASRYNLVQNGDFRNSGTNWTTLSGSTAAYDTEDDIAAPQLDGNVVEFTGDATKEQNISQTVPVSGSAGDTFIIAGWAKGDAAPLTENEDYPRQYGVVAKFHYTDDTTKEFVAQFNPDTDSSVNWQYSSEVMVAEKAFDYITVAVTYDRNVNSVMFDGIQLIKEEFGTSYTYDNEGNVISVVDLQKKNTTYEYEGNDLTKIMENGNAKMEYTYDDFHNVKTASSAEGLSYSFEYDTYGNNTQVSITENNVTMTSRATYTTDGNRMLTSTDAAGNTTTYDYDTNTNVLVSVKYPNDTSATKTNYTYDSMYRMASAAATTNNGNALSATYTYSDDLLTAIRTGSNAVYTFTYGDFALREKISIGSRTLATYSYTEDQNNYLDTLAYGNGDSVEYEYDDQGRVIAETYKDNGVTSSSVTYQYNNSGALATVTDSATQRTTTYYYDFTDRMMKYVESGTNFSHTVGYEYDELNNLSSQVETVNGETRTVSYSYDDDNRLTQTQDGSSVRTYSYDGFGRLASYVTRYDGATKLTQNYTYRTVNGGATGQVASVNYVGVDGGFNRQYTYTYDNNGNILSISDGTNTTTYVYDSANQLIRENNQAGEFTHTWTYDNGGNITSRKEYDYTTGALPATPKDTIAYTYYSGTWRDLIYTYDGQYIDTDTIGNILSDATWRYTWQHGRQLASMQEKNGTLTWSFTYDANGMRTKRTNGTTTYEYVYNGSQLTGMTVKSGNTTDTVRISYDSGKPMFIKLNGTTYQYVTNVQGDVIAILNSSGVPVVEYTYDAWGNILDIKGSLKDTLGIINPLRYRGYVYDQETGLYYLQSRYYNPTWGRFINADIYASTGQGFIGHNMFVYCGNTPVRNVDTSGTFFFTAMGAVTGFVGGAIVSALLGKSSQDILNDAVAGAVGGAIAGAGVDTALLIVGTMGAAVPVVAAAGAVAFVAGGVGG